jgi:hypothetical protein
MCMVVPHLRLSFDCLQLKGFFACVGGLIVKRDALKFSRYFCVDDVKLKIIQSCYQTDHYPIICTLKNCDSTHFHVSEL